MKPHDRLASSGNSVSRGVDMVTEYESTSEEKTKIYLSPSHAMSIVLPGEQVPAHHVNLKLGPGLLQLSSPNPTQTSSIIATRAGTLNHSSNGRKWWVENNSRRVSIHRHPCTLQLSWSHNPDVNDSTSIFQHPKNPS